MKLLAQSAPENTDIQTNAAVSSGRSFRALRSCTTATSVVEAPAGRDPSTINRSSCTTPNHTPPKREEEESDTVDDPKIINEDGTDTPITEKTEETNSHGSEKGRESVVIATNAEETEQPPKKNNYKKRISYISVIKILTSQASTTEKVLTLF